MPGRKKLQLMEPMWADLSGNDANLNPLHGMPDALRETSARVARGQEKILDWEQAKKEITEGQG